MESKPTFIKVYDRWSRPQFLNADYIVAAVPYEGEDDKVICQLMMSNGMIMSVTKMAPGFEDWAKKE